MAEVASDSPLSNAPAAHGKSQRTPSAAHTQQKRNNRNRKNINQFDGAVSDGAVAMSIPSPQSKKTQKQRQQSMNMGVRPVQQHGNPGTQNAQKARPVSVGAGLQPETPAKGFEPAYAGPTFSNSPAASALPVPKFFSKSVPNVARPSSVHSKPAGERPPIEPQSSPESDNASPAPPPEPPQSPLDLFFKADRAEKEKSRNFSKSLSPNVPRASPSNGGGNAYQHSGKSGKSIFLSELDGDDTNMPSTRTVAPPGRPSPVERSYSSPNVRSPEAEDERLANTKSLKELLFNTAANASMTPPQTRSGRNSGSQTPEPFFGSPSPFNGSGPSTPRPQEQQNHYSLHYGNRNLSPMFKAVRADTPPRPSSLRQEFPSDAVSGANPAPSHPSSVDPNTFARSYLKDQIRAYGPAEMPQIPFTSGPKPVHASNNMPENGAAPISVQPVNPQRGVSQSAASPRNGSRDVQTMENDLRRMLKLNV